MYSKEVFERGSEVGAERRKLPATTYNTMRLLLEHSENGCVFVPIRSMQYMAVVDAEEVIFVDAVTARRSIEFSWRGFQPQKRCALSDPVDYQFVWYADKALAAMRRAQGEFSHFIQQMASRQPSRSRADEATVLPFNKT